MEGGEAMNTLPTLYATVGLPRSGKTTWAKAASVLHAWPIVNPDSIRLALHGQRYQQEAEGFVWAIAKVMVRALFLAGHKGVILDATNTSDDRRKAWVSRSWFTTFVPIRTPAEECVRRAVEDAEIIPVIGRMAESMTWPGSEDSHSADADSLLAPER
jgi:predicted kinase